MNGRDARFPLPHTHWSAHGARGDLSVCRLNGEMTWRLYHYNSEIRAQLNYLIKIFISIRSCLLSFKRSRSKLTSPSALKDPTVQSSTLFNMNFTKDLVLCEIIEWHEGKSIIVVNFFYCRIIIQNDTVLTVMVCAWTSVKYLELRC